MQDKTMTDEESAEYIARVLKKTGKSNMRVIMQSVLIEDVLRSIDESKDGTLRKLVLVQNLDTQSHEACKRAFERLADCYRDVIITAMMSLEELSEGAGHVFLATMTENDALLNEVVKEKMDAVPVDMSKN